MPILLYHLPLDGQPLWAQRFRIAQHETHEAMLTPTPDAFGERFANLPANQSEQVLVLLDRLSQTEPGEPPQARHYADMQQVLTLMGSMAPRPHTDPTAVLNSLALLTHQLGMSFTTPLDIFRKLYHRLPVDPKRLAEIRLKQEEKARRLNLKKSLPHRAEANLLNKAEALSPAEIKRVLAFLTSAVDTGENFDGLKNGGYKQPEQTRAIQEALIALGYYKGTADSDYGPQTRLAVKRLQMDLNVSADGAFGNGTFLALRNFLEARLAGKEREQKKSEKVMEPKRSTIVKTEVQQFQENQKTFLDYLKQLEGIHGPEIVGDILNLRFDPRDMSNNEASSAYTPEGGRVGRTFFKQNGEIYFSVSRNVNDTNFNNRVFHKLGDKRVLFILPRKGGTLVPANLTNKDGIYLSEINGEKKLLDKAGYMAHLKGKKYIFEEGHAFDEAYSIADIHIQ